MTVIESEVRTFVHTAWGFRLELQRRWDVVDDEREAVITEAALRMPFSADPRMLAEWLGAEVLEEQRGITIHRDGWRLRITGDRPWLDGVYLKSVDQFEAVDPVGVRLVGMRDITEAG
jgi:hypothetical protein